jgi:hypothetical protein
MMAMASTGILPWIVLGSIGVLLALLIHGRLAPVVLFSAWAVGYFLLGLVNQSVFLGGYTNSALVTLLVLLLVSLALNSTTGASRP